MKVLVVTHHQVEALQGLGNYTLTIVFLILLIFQFGPTCFPGVFLVHIAPFWAHLGIPLSESCQFSWSAISKTIAMSSKWERTLVY